MREETQTAIMWILVAVVSGIVAYQFSEKHGKFMTECQNDGKSFVQCWELLR